MKKVYIGIFSMVVLGAMTLSVHAETTTLSYTQTSTYTLQIPSTLELKSATSESLTIGVSAINMTPSEKLQIKCTGGIDASGNTTLTRSGGGTTSVKVTTTSGGTTGITTDTVLAQFENQSTIATAGGTIYFAPVGSVDAGNYSGAVVFTASTVN